MHGNQEADGSLWLVQDEIKSLKPLLVSRAETY